MSDYDRSIHSNPDAAAWAKLFMETWAKNGGKGEWITEGLMLGWFANAMMAKADSLASAPAPVEAPDLSWSCPACEDLCWAQVSERNVKIGLHSWCPQHIRMVRPPAPVESAPPAEPGTCPDLVAVCLHLFDGDDPTHCQWCGTGRRDTP